MLRLYSFGSSDSAETLGIVCDVDNQGQEFGVNQEKE